jgi:hypothetical protein
VDKLKINIKNTLLFLIGMADMRTDACISAEGFLLGPMPKGLRGGRNIFRVILLIIAISIYKVYSPEGENLGALIVATVPNIMFPVFYEVLMVELNWWNYKRREQKT